MPDAEKLNAARWSSVVMALLTCALAGCYDTAALVKARQDSRDLATMEEVDLGSYRITLPHELGVATDRLIDFHVFGHVTRGDRQAIDDALRMRGAELRAKMLIEVRAMDPHTFEEAELGTLRKSIAEVINGTLGRQVVKHVGFFRFSFNTM
ncbi:MAG: hypothetical protein JNL18_15400 [Planctomycetaceae bacterium]|jgi:hypothetical protein|nr:hypothetical protein [Planctomycetaceae bacterium]